MCFDLVLERYQTFLFQMLRNRPFLFLFIFYFLHFLIAPCEKLRVALPG